MGNFKEVNCPFCNRTVRNTDKFCIFCGSRLTKSDPPKPTADIPKDEKKQLEKEVSEELDFMHGAMSKSTDDQAKPFLLKEDSHEKLETRVIETSEEKEKKDKKAASDNSPVELSEDIKEQLELRMNLALVEKKKSKLKEKLKDLKDSLDGDRYEYDVDYGKTINLKLEAFKSLKEELNQEEETIRSEITGKFRVDELEEEMELKRQQLIELKRSFKMHHIKKDVYEQLKQEYADQFEEDQTELQDLRTNIIRWLSKEKAEKNQIDGRIRLLRGRFKSGEISEEKYQQDKTDLEKQIEKIDQRVDILENYSKEQKKKWF